ncbi:pentatricopeptide repeat-containing protein At3g26540-like [Arachis stenosperma]|uniref:pentatricopeptide repeat-containing protein At3g26540-like n=1 Tax=Arachis stenosperma TaxID=217475 RepID=UPI0025AD2392|nr:pentatricopeptide repeat-containing protein At3g26540-like [Arachis stenosperma]
MGVSAASILNHLLQAKNLKPQPRSTATNTTKAAITTILSHVNAGHICKAASVLFAFPAPFPYSLYAHLFQHCTSPRAVVGLRKAESHLLTFSPTPPIFLLNRAIEAYGRCDSLRDARELFDEMPQPDGGSWNALINAYSQRGFSDEVFKLFLKMNRCGVYPNQITLAGVLGSCAVASEIVLAKQAHGIVVKFGFCRNVILGSSLVNVYGKFGIMVDARRMFQEIPSPNAVTWNIIVRRYLDAGDAREAIVLFSRMFLVKVRPLHFTFSAALVACASISRLEEGMQIHGVVVKLGLHEDNVVSSSLINMYMKCGKLEDGHEVFDQIGSKDLVSWTSIVYGYAMCGKTWEARKIFDEMPERNVISWNAMLAGYARFCDLHEALDFIYLMLGKIKDVDHVTLSLMLNVSAGLSDHEMGKQVHGYIYRHGFHSNLSAGNALLDMYGKCGNLNSATVWFNQMSNRRDWVSWNALLASYDNHQLSEQALTKFLEMQLETKPTKYTFGTLLAACANSFSLNFGKQIHGFIIRHEFEMDIIIRTALVHMYSRCRCLEYAIEVLKGAISRDVVIWNTMILGYCHNHRGKEALELFQLMEAEGINPDQVTFQGILLACVEEGLVDVGADCFRSMSNEYYVLPRLEHYDCMIELYSRHGYMDELENFLKTMPIEPTLSMLRRAFEASQKNRYSRLGEWITHKLNEFEH